ncbi:MAG: SRPBCC family protein [Sporichthyaceae bacterium]
MSDETMTATLHIEAPAEAVFAVLADPGSHAAIDGTGWVREPIDGGAPIVAEGRVFEVAMYHSNHPDGDYRMANRVTRFEPPRAIEWEPGQYDESGTLGTGGWTWRYDLAPAADGGTDVLLTYDWSAVPAPIREYISFPPFPPEHLQRSLGHLAGLVQARA